MKASLKKHMRFSLNTKIFFALIVAIILLSSCETTPREPDPNYLGDFDPIQLENIMCIRESFGNLKATEVRLFFIPRTNVIEAYLRDGMTQYVLLFKGEERQQFIEGIDIYAQTYSSYADGNTSALPEREPDRKNYFNAGTMSVSWGAINLAQNNTTTFQTNYKYLEPNKPYFELMVESTLDKAGSGAASPVLRLYFSPPQLETLLTQIDQKKLQQLIDDLEKAAFEF